MGNLGLLFFMLGRLYGHDLIFSLDVKEIYIVEFLLLKDELYMAQGNKNLSLNLRSILRKMSLYPSLAAASMPQSVLSIVDLNEKLVQFFLINFN